MTRLSLGQNRGTQGYVGRTDREAGGYQVNAESSSTADIRESNGAREAERERPQTLRGDDQMLKKRRGEVLPSQALDPDLESTQDRGK